MVMGNRNQLQWDLPALDSFELIRADLPPRSDEFRRTRDELIELLDLGELVNKPVRNLSLGERMKMEIVGGAPPPAEGPVPRRADARARRHDAEADPVVRRRVQPAPGATVLLTSHYMADVQALCKRVIVIHHGRILFDGGLAELPTRFDATKTIGVMLKDGTADLSAYGEVLASDDGRVVLRVSRADAPEVTTRLLRDLPVADLTIEDPPIEDVIERVFATPATDGAGPPPRRRGRGRRPPGARSRRRYTRRRRGAA